MTRWCLLHITTNTVYAKLLKIEPETYRDLIDYLKENITTFVDNMLLEWNISRENSTAYLQILMSRMNKVSHSFTYDEFDLLIRREVANQIASVSKLYRSLPRSLRLIIANFIPYAFPTKRKDCHHSNWCRSCGRCEQVNKEITLNIDFMVGNEGNDYEQSYDQWRTEKEYYEDYVDHRIDDIDRLLKCRNKNEKNAYHHRRSRSRNTVQSMWTEIFKTVGAVFF